MRRNEAGFTLIEMLIALVVLAIAMAAVNEGLRFSSRALSASATRSEELSSRASALSTVRRLIQDTSPVALPSETSDAPELLFEGEPDRLRLVAFLPGYVDEAGLYAVTLEIERERRGSVLRLSRSVIDRTETPLSWPRSDEGAILLHSKGTLRFGYLSGTGGEGDGTWDDDLALPSAIQLIEDKGSDRILLTATIPSQASWLCAAEALLFCPLEEVFQ